MDPWKSEIPENKPTKEIASTAISKLNKNNTNSPFREAYRPKTLSEIVETVNLSQLKVLATENNIHVLLFEGPTGVGKTTCARILAKARVCLSDSNERPCLTCESCLNFDKGFDVIELNIADTRKIDDIREIVSDMNYAPQILSKKVYIFDEVHQLTNDSQQLLLKVFENPPKHVLIICCTTSVENLKQTLLDRTHRVVFNTLTPLQAKTIITKLYNDNNKNLTQNELEKLYNSCHGSVRALLNNIEISFQNGKLATDENNDFVLKTLAQSIFNKNWSQIRTQLKSQEIIKNSDSVYRAIINYTRASLLNSEDSIKFNKILKIFLVQPLNPSAGYSYNELVSRCATVCED